MTLCDNRLLFFESFSILPAQESIEFDNLFDDGVFLVDFVEPNAAHLSGGDDYPILFQLGPKLLEGLEINLSVLSNFCYGVIKVSRIH